MHDWCCCCCTNIHMNRTRLAFSANKPSACFKTIFNRDAAWISLWARITQQIPWMGNNQTMFGIFELMSHFEPINPCQSLIVVFMIVREWFAGLAFRIFAECSFQFLLLVIALSNCHSDVHFRFFVDIVCNCNCDWSAAFFSCLCADNKPFECFPIS